MAADLRLIRNHQLAAMTLALGITHYLQRVQARGAALNTLRAYGSDLRQFAAWLEGQGILLVALISARHVGRWLDDLAAQRISARSQARKLSVLRAFVKHARREVWLQHDPTADEQVKFRARRVIAPEMAQLHAMVDAIAGTRPEDLRDRAMLRLALDCGLRISEVAGLDLPGVGSQATVDLHRGLVHVVGKGGNAETVPFNERTGRALAAWLHARGEPKAAGELALFLTKHGTRPSRQALHEMVKRRAAATGMPGLHWHLMRHRRIAQVLEACGVKVAQQLARHACEATTSEYGAHASNIAFALVRERADVDAEQRRSA